MPPFRTKYAVPAQREGGPTQDLKLANRLETLERQFEALAASLPASLPAQRDLNHKKGA